MLVEHSLYLLVGLAMVLFGVLNIGNQLARQWVKRLGAAVFGDSAARRLIDEFADSRFARTFYGSITTIFVLFIGVMWVIISINLVIGDLRH